MNGEIDLEKQKFMNELEDGFMGVDLLEHNQEAFQEINKMIESGIKKIAVPRATGSGKSYLMGALAEQYNNDKKLVLEPTRPLLNSIKEKFDEFGIANTDFITYQKLIRMRDEDIAEMDYKLIFLDEFHHGTAPVWGLKIDCLMKTHSDSIIFGTSATTIRNDGVNVVETLFDNNAVGELSLSTAIAKKVLPCPHYITAIYRLDDEFEKLKKRIEDSTNTKDEKKEFYRKMQEMKLHFEKSYGVPLILNKYIKVKNGKYLVFCKNKKHLDSMRSAVIEWFHTAGIKNIHSYAVYSDYPEKEKDYKAFCDDNSDSLKLLFSINMLNEGLHIKDISGVLMLRTTQSILVYLQQLGRLVEAENLDKYLVVFDFVNNFSSVDDGIGLLKEIKEAIAKGKESDPNFDDSGLDDIDTFFVIDQVLEVQEMFREIEERLKGDWDLYIKALKQYKEREGDCSMSDEYIEQIDGKDVNLGSWCGYIRGAKNRTSHGRLTEEMEEQLNEIGFIWNEIEYRFEKNAKGASEYYQNYQKYPSYHSKDLKLKQIALFIKKQKKEMRNEKYPEWKLKIMNKYLPNFCCKNSFELFIENASLYRKRYGHLGIKKADIIDGFPIGSRWWTLKKTYEDNRLSKGKIDQLINIGFSLEIKHLKTFDEKIAIAEQAIRNGIIISNTNRTYEDIDFYAWIKTTVKIKYENNRLTKEQICVIENLVGKPIYTIFNYNGDFIKVIDVLKDEDVSIYSSKSKAIEYIRENFGYPIHVVVISNYLNGKCKSPYKGRFIFEYASDEEIKKYLEGMAS